MSCSKFARLSPIHREIVETINSLSFLGFDLTQGLTEMKVSFGDHDSEFVDWIFSTLGSVIMDESSGWTLELDLLSVDLDALRISFFRIDPLGTFQVTLSQLFCDAAVESLVFNVNPRNPLQKPVLLNTKDGIILAGGEREVTDDEVIAEIRKFVSENYTEPLRKEEL